MPMRCRVVLREREDARVSLRSCFQAELFFYYIVPLLAESGCRKEFISSKLCFVACNYSKSHVWDHPSPPNSSATFSASSFLRSNPVDCAGFNTSDIKHLISFKHLENLCHVSCAWAQDVVRATAAQTILTRALLEWLFASCTQGPKRLKASKVFGRDSWRRKSAAALWKPEGSCHFPPGEGADLRGALTA